MEQRGVMTNLELCMGSPKSEKSGYIISIMERGGINSPTLQESVGQKL